MLHNKYKNIEPYPKKLAPDFIHHLTAPKNAPKQKNNISKNQNITVEDQKEIYKICNRDLIYGNGYEKVELGEVYEIGTVVKDKNRMRSRIERTQNK